MLSDLHCNTFSCDFSPLEADPDEDPFSPLNFDDLLDIAREFEFTQTITHIWPCEELSTCSDTGLDDILAAIVPTLNAEESPAPLPSDGSHRPTSPASAENTDVFMEPLAPLKREDQGSPKLSYPPTPVLRGWSPPDGSQFLDLPDNLMLPQSMKGVWIPPLPAASFTSAKSKNDSSETVPAIGDPSPLQSEASLASAIDKATDGPTDKTASPAPVERAPEPLCPSEQACGKAPRKTVAPVHGKSSKSRGHRSSAVRPSAPKYAKAPRGGIPPHIARTVTKANILLMEKERRVMQDTLSNSTMRDGEKPSVLRRATKTEKECGSRQKSSDVRDANQKGGRAAKRAKA